jgi:hypothetical protein
VDAFQNTQQDAYLELWIDRARNQYLTWVEQALDIIEERLGDTGGASVNDVGCNLGLFWKGLKRRGLVLDYRGYDVEQLYLDHALEIFPELDGRISRLDITSATPPTADVSVTSATLEHLDHLHPALDHFLDSAERLIVLRTFLGEAPVRSLQKLEGAQNPYWVHQHAFQDVLDSFDRHGFVPSVLRDRHTDSMPIYMQNGIVRTCYFVVGARKD